MGSRTYIIPSDDMTLTDKTNYRVSAIAAGIARAHGTNVGSIGDDEIPGFSKLGTAEMKTASVKNYIMGGGWPKAFDVREFRPVLDAASALDQWNTAALAAVGTAYSCLQAVAAPANPNNRYLVFYKMGCETVPMPIALAIFRKGGATGNILAQFDAEQLINHQNIEGYFSEPVVIDPAITYAVQVVCRIATGLLARVQFGCLVVEPQGQTIA